MVWCLGKWHKSKHLVGETYCKIWTVNPTLVPLDILLNEANCQQDTSHVTGICGIESSIQDLLPLNQFRGLAKMFNRFGLFFWFEQSEKSHVRSIISSSFYFEILVDAKIIWSLWYMLHNFETEQLVSGVGY